MYDDEGHVRFTFGKYKGELVSAVLAKDPGYFGWMMNGDFPRYTKRVMQQVKDGQL